MSTSSQADVCPGADFDTDSIFTSHSYSASSLSDGSDDEQHDVAENIGAPSTAFLRLKDLLQQRDHQILLHTDQRPEDEEPEAVSTELETVKVNTG